MSLVSAASIIKAMPPEKYEVVEIGITHDGKWLVDDKISGTSENLAENSCLTEFKRKLTENFLRPI